MTITKTSVNYSISDSLENGWNISGNMNTADTETSITLFIKKDPEESKGTESPKTNSEIGNYFWRRSDRVNVSYSIANDADEANFLATCKKIVEEAISAK